MSDCRDVFKCELNEIEKGLGTDNSGCFYHYTSPMGMVGILKGKKIWFTDSDYLNDSSEGHDVFNVIRKVLNNNDHRYKKGFPQEIKKAIGGIIDNNVQRKTFLCCFSRDNDSLPMWNYYVKNQNSIGFNIQFDGKRLFDLVSEYYRNYDHNKLIEIKKFGLIYEDDTKSTIIRDILVCCNKYWTDDNTSKINKSIISEFKKIIYDLRYRFKDSHFSSEKEIRIMISMSDNIFNSMLKRTDELEIKVRDIKNMYVPYIEVPFNSNEIEYLIKEIGVSPTLNDTLAINSVKTLLQKYGFTKCKILKSKIPLRY